MTALSGEAPDDPRGANRGPDAAAGPRRTGIEVPTDAVEAMTGLLREEMEGAAALSVPLVVEVGHGPDRDAAHEILVEKSIRASPFG
jgi:predicted TIM-barrel fold metal-dependent hydrolase